MSKEITPEHFKPQQGSLYPLWDYLYEQHDCVLLSEDLHEIIHIVNKIQGYVPPEE